MVVKVDHEGKLLSLLVYDYDYDETRYMVCPWDVINTICSSEQVFALLTIADDARIEGWIMWKGRGPVGTGRARTTQDYVGIYVIVKGIAYTINQAVEMLQRK